MTGTPTSHDDQTADPEDLPTDNRRNGDDLVGLPATPLGHAVLVEMSAQTSTPIGHHSIRSFLFARLLADHLGARKDATYDEELLFCTCALHDMGLATTTGGTQRFEVEGADRAAAFLTEHGLPGGKVDQVWEAIALHSSFQIAERRGLLCQLTRLGVGMDFGYDTDFVTDAQAAAIHTAWPRLNMERVLVDTIVGQVTAVPSKAPRYSLAAVLVDQRAAPPHITALETAAADSRWAAF